jgi:hypothetical protein
VVVIFLFGLFNNLNSFFNIYSSIPRKIEIGNSLLIICIVTLIFQSDTNGTLFYYENFNQYSCKIVSYLLFVCTRIIYWLTSCITIERLCLVLYLKFYRKQILNFNEISPKICPLVSKKIPIFSKLRVYYVSELHIKNKMNR